MIVFKRFFWCLSILFTFFCATVTEGAIPRPARIFGTVTVDGTALTQDTDDGYTFEVTRPDGSAFEPTPTLPDGLNCPAGYSINVPLYDVMSQPGGAVPEETAVIHVYKSGSSLSVTSPNNGQFSVGEAGAITQMNLVAVSPAPVQYQLATAVTGGHGTVSPTGGTYNEGTVVTLTAVPAAGYGLPAWSGTDDDSSASTTNTVTMNANRSVTVSFMPIPPEIKSFTATPAKITKGEFSTLTWNIVGATSASINNGIGAVSPTGGSIQESPAGTKTYTLTAGNAVGSVTQTVTVTVEDNPSLPTIQSFAATPATINAGGSADLSWTITGATSASINNGVGTVSPSGGKVQVSPAGTTGYTLTATNSTGSVSRTVTVSVTAQPLPVIHSFTAAPQKIDPGGFAVLSWDITDATSAVINQGVGAVNSSGGSRELAPENTTTYLLTATNEGGSVTATATVTVKDSSPPEIVETIPHDGAGINDLSRVPNDSSFCVRIKSANGIDLTDPTSVRFTIDDGFQANYTRALDDISVVRVIKLTDDDDHAVRQLWVVYDRSKEDGFGTYSYDTQINVDVDVRDSEGLEMPPESYFLWIETQEQHNAAEAALPDTAPLNPSDPDLVDSQYFYDVGVEVTGGDLRGAKIIYDSNEPIQPKFGPVGEIPRLDAESIGAPMNLQPPNVFNTPVKLLIPYPGYSDVSDLCIYLFNGEKWALACDAAGNIQPGGEGWMVPGSRVNHNHGDPSTIEIKVHHFSAVQAGVDGMDSGSCFISTSGTAHPSLLRWQMKWIQKLRDLMAVSRDNTVTE
jgi:hypothetical protein